MIEYRVQKWILHQKYWIEASVRPGVKHPGVEKKVEKSSYPVEHEGKKNSMYPLEKSVYPLEKEKHPSISPTNERLKNPWESTLWDDHPPTGLVTGLP